jgi:aryl-alcohol dehydrogenase-like predicted oxidoreductase
MPEGSRGADENSNMFMGNVLTDETLQKVQNLGKIAEKFGCTIGQLALAWCLRQPGVSSVIVGASKVSQIEENAVASGLMIPPEAWDQADVILA